MRRWLAAAAAALLLAACSSPAEPGVKPTFGGDPGADVDQSALAAAKEAAGIDECPAVDGSSDLPALTLDCLGGGAPMTLSNVAGPAVINLWASWCNPCREELPLLARAHGEFADVQFFGIDVADSAPDAAIALAAGSGVTYPLLVDLESATRGKISYQGLPVTVFVASDGSVTTVNRAFSSYDDLTEAIETHLGVTP